MALSLFIGLSSDALWALDEALSSMGTCLQSPPVSPLDTRATSDGAALQSHGRFNVNVHRSVNYEENGELWSLGSSSVVSCGGCWWMMLMVASGALPFTAGRNNCL